MTKKIGDTFNVSSTKQSGGLTVGQVNFNLQPGWRDIRHAPQDLQNLANIVAHNSGKAFKFRVPMGDHEAMNYAGQLRDVLKANGIDVEDFISEGAGGGPLPKLSWMKEGESAVIQVGNQNSPVQPDGKA